MKNFIPFIVSVFLTNFISAQPYVNKYDSEGYRFVWSDEFSHDGAVNSEEWIVDDGKFDGTAESYKMAKNAKVMNGKLCLLVNKENKTVDMLSSKVVAGKKSRSKYVEFSSALLHLKRKWKYGRFEFRARFDVAKGLWPAVWTLGANYKTVGWPKCGEIDILEVLKNRAMSNFHYASTSNKPVLKAKYHSVHSLSLQHWAKEFHTWIMDWDEDSIKIYVDGMLVNDIDLNKLTTKDGYNPFRQPHSFLIGMPANSKSAGKLNQAERFPKKFEIDYFRVYQRK